MRQAPIHISEPRRNLSPVELTQGFPCGSDSKESICNAGDQEEGNVYPPQYSCLRNPMDREA